jgi:hypothetical protein
MKNILSTILVAALIVLSGNRIASAGNGPGGGNAITGSAFHVITPSNAGLVSYNRSWVYVNTTGSTWVGVVANNGNYGGLGAGSFSGTVNATLYFYGNGNNLTCELELTNVANSSLYYNDVVGSNVSGYSSMTFTVTVPPGSAGIYGSDIYCNLPYETGTGQPAYVFMAQ